jgi:hypothetical protein
VASNGICPSKFGENQSIDSKIEMDTLPQHDGLRNQPPPPFLRKENRLKIIFNVLSENVGYFSATNIYLKKDK